jgi:histidyl-tRNA synthetase
VKYKRPRGTQDIIPPDIQIWRNVEEAFIATFERYGYQPIRTPLFESTDLFIRSVGEQTDIISKEMYTFTDRGGRSITLRPENTASVIRAYLENGMHRLGGVRLYYIGPMFRYDRPQAGRYRQFHQVGIEAIGSIHPAIDAEVIDTVMSTLQDLAFRDLTLTLNSVGCPVCRGPYRKILTEALLSAKSMLCDDCAERADNNPMRVFDCKKCVEVKQTLPTIADHLCEDCKAHHRTLKEMLAELGHKFEDDPFLVRGLDYYTRTAFEILHGELGAQNALCGGGRYDNLVEQCGGPATPAIGYSAGLERIISVLPQNSPARAGVAAPDIYLACVDEPSLGRALRAAKLLRRSFSVQADLTLRTLKKQMKNAEKSGAAVAVIVDGERGDVVAWKNLSSREQFDVTDTDLLSFTRGQLRKHTPEGGKAS